MAEVFDLQISYFAPSRPFDIAQDMLGGKYFTTECFNRGSSSYTPGFPLKACGNDGIPS